MSRFARHLSVMRAPLAAAALVFATGCASAPPCPAPPPNDTPTCPEPVAAAPAAPKPVLVDRRNDTPQLDRGRTMSLEAFSVDGRLALVRVNDSATGESFQVLDLPTGRPTQTFGVMALGEREARVRGMKALGKTQLLTWSNRHPDGQRTALFSATADAFAILIDAGHSPDTLALLPRHVSTDRRANTETPASATRVTIAWPGDGAHVFVIYGQITADTPALSADRWFAIPVAFKGR